MTNVMVELVEPQPQRTLDKDLAARGARSRHGYQTPEWRSGKCEEKASKDWAIQMRGRLRRSLDELLVSRAAFRRLVTEFVLRRGYALLGFHKFTEFVKAPQPDGLGVTDKAQFFFVLAAIGEELAVRECGAPLPAEAPNAIGSIDMSEFRRKVHGNSSLLLLKELAKRRPDILELFRQGKYESVRAAALAAGIRRPVSLVQVAKRTVNRFSDAENVEFSTWYRPKMPKASIKQ